MDLFRCGGGSLVHEIEQRYLDFVQGRAISYGRFEASCHQVRHIVVRKRLRDRAAVLNPSAPVIVLLPAIEARVDLMMPVGAALAHRVDSARHDLVEHDSKHEHAGPFAKLSLVPLLRCHIGSRTCELADGGRKIDATKVRD